MERGRSAYWSAFAPKTLGVNASVEVCIRVWCDDNYTCLEIRTGNSLNGKKIFDTESNVENHYLTNYSTYWNDFCKMSENIHSLSNAVTTMGKTAELGFEFFSYALCGYFPVNKACLIFMVGWAQCVCERKTFSAMRVSIWLGRDSHTVLAILLRIARAHYISNGNVLYFDVCFIWYANGICPNDSNAGVAGWHSWS